SLKRSPSLPDVPTLDEAGVKGFEAIAWFGLYMPASKGGPSPVQGQLEAAMQEILASAKIKEQFSALGLDPGTLTGEAFKGFVGSEI
ncbi:tripartite tricarboxylate transporter substrate-binding protein, partial [Vibrio parahaemolyticus]